MDEIIQFLEKAIASRSSVTIKYNGGSQPGSIREITPTKISGDRIFAFCTASNANKSFVISKIEIPEIGNNVDYDAAFKHMFEFDEQNGLFPLYDKFCTEWEEYGWAVESGKDYIYLFRRYKNGKALKYPHVRIEYIPETYDYTDFNSDGEEVNYGKPNPRPWFSCGNYYKHFDKAVQKFLEQSRTISPVAGAK